MKSRQQSVGKEAPVYVDNEDAWRSDNEARIWALADGAGGTGIYAGEWAQYLVRQVPNVPFGVLSDLALWLDEHWNAFFDVYHPKSQTSYFTDQKFMQEGSGATLTTLHQCGEQMHWMVYGDAVALCFQPATGELWAANPDVCQFASAPYLLNWLALPHPDGFRSGSWQHQPGQQYALLSDALGQYVLMAYAALQGDTESLQIVAQQPTELGNRAHTHLGYWVRKRATFRKSVWKPLRTALATPDRFLSYTHRLRARQLVGADDYTGILIED